MSRRLKLNRHIIFYSTLLIFVISKTTLAETPKLIGFQQMADEINQRRSNHLYKLEGKIYQLRLSQNGNYSLTLTPVELFEIVKISGNQFTVTLVNPRSLWKKHKKKPFKIKWKVDEIASY
jgi:hypothetical protein